MLLPSNNTTHDYNLDTFDVLLHLLFTFVLAILLSGSGFVVLIAVIICNNSK